ncbi:MAG: class IV adenylate cyclase [Pirellulales bacterium]|nr:class IV adenylate cyclase [Pirellulales bacterium]
MPQNIEWKGAIKDWEQARATAARLATQPVERQTQVDTYFDSRRGRLKLREIATPLESWAELIWYERANLAGTKASTYTQIPVADAAVLREVLSASMGVVVRVAKTREIWLHQHVRIHLDQVAGLGNFLEFEAVLSTSEGEELLVMRQSRELVERLIGEFGLDPAEGIASSYQEMMLPRAGRG